MANPLDGQGTTAIPWIERVLPEIHGGDAHAAGPLFDLLRDDATWEWRDERQSAFTTLRARLCTAPLSLHPNLNIPFSVDTDASATAVGGVLLQDQGAGLQLVAFYSLTLDAAQRNYAVHERELLALVVATRRWRWALLSCPPFQWRTDHAPLLHIKDQTKLSPRQARWLEYLSKGNSQFHFISHYVRGEAHLGADALSRLPTLAAVMGSLRYMPLPHSKALTGPRARLRDSHQIGLHAVTGQGAPTPTPADTLDQETWRTDVIRALTTDPVAVMARRSARDDANTKRSKVEDSLFYRGRLYIPDVPYLRAAILREVHAAPWGGTRAMRGRLTDLRRSSTGQDGERPCRLISGPALPAS